MAEYTLVAEKTGELRLDAAAKEERYATLAAQIEATLAGEPDLTAAMASVACLLHNGFPYYFWTGFYRRVGPTRLLVGPYQGTLGCLDIEFARGVCGACATREETIVVDDVHAFPGHIACDSASASEIVVPVFDARGALIAVLDVDSTIPARLRRGRPALAGAHRRAAARQGGDAGGVEGVRAGPTGTPPGDGEPRARERVNPPLGKR